MTKKNDFDIIEYIKENWRTGIKLIFGIGVFIGVVYYRLPFMLGLISGMCIVGYMFLFPNPTALIFFDKLFGYSKKEAIIMKNESQENEVKVNEITKKYRVKFNR